MSEESGIIQVVEEYYDLSLKMSKIREFERKAKERMDELKKQIEEYMGDRSSITIGNFLVTKKRIRRSIIDTDFLRELLGDRIKEVQRTVEYTRVTVKTSGRDRHKNHER